MEEIKKMILSTLAYYDLFDFPLTAKEIEKYLVVSKTPISKEKIEDSLEELISEDAIITDRGFFALSKREQIVPLRIRRSGIVSKKIRRAQNVARWMAVVPYLRAVLASGSLALGNTDEDSDLDVLVITRAGRIWTTRFLTTILLSFLGVRRKAGLQIAPDKVCLNHYIADDALTIKNQNVFTARIYAHLLPLYLYQQSLFEQFRANNQWLLSHVRQWPTQTQYLLKVGPITKSVKKVFELGSEILLGQWFETWTRRLQKKRIERNPKTSQPNGRIEYNDRVLQFHPDSIEKQILEKYEHLLRFL